MVRPTSSTICLDCGGHVDQVGPLSRRGYCGGCGERRTVENARQLAEHDGPYFELWRDRVAASVGAHRAGIREREQRRRAREADAQRSVR